MTLTYILGNIDPTRKVDPYPLPPLPGCLESVGSAYFLLEAQINHQGTTGFGRFSPCILEVFHSNSFPLTMEDTLKQLSCFLFEKQKGVDIMFSMILNSCKRFFNGAWKHSEVLKLKRFV